MIYGVILAAGKGTRMKNNRPKGKHQIFDKTLLEYITSAVEQTVDKVCIVINNDDDKIVGRENIEYAYQLERLGTGHALKQTESLMANRNGTVLVTLGDTPLLKAETLKQLIEYHNYNNNDATILTVEVEDPFGYGRIIKSGKNLLKIVEQKDCTEEEKRIKEINTGVCVFNLENIFDFLNLLKTNNTQNEYYLTDVVEMMANRKMKVESFICNDENEILGVNDLVQLENITKLMQERINKDHMLNGVQICSSHSTYIGPDVIIGSGTIIYPNTTILGNTVIGNDCLIDDSYLNNVTIKNKTNIIKSHIVNCSIGSNISIGPYARLRENTIIHDEAKIGNFVEMKNTSFGKNSKSAHLSYLGDSLIGNNVNIGCGTITVNYDGKNKFITTIEDNAFIGCNSNLIAPITIGQNSFVAAGSTIVKDVGDDDLAIARSKQINKEKYAKKYR